MIGLEMVATGKLSSSEADQLSGLLARDLCDLPGNLIASAIQKHRQSSPFWPALSDIMKHIQPTLDAQAAAQMREQRRNQAYYSNRPPKVETPEEREAFLKQQEMNHELDKKVTGWKGLS